MSEDDKKLCLKALEIMKSNRVIGEATYDGIRRTIEQEDNGMDDGEMYRTLSREEEIWHKRYRALLAIEGIISNVWNNLDECEKDGQKDEADDNKTTAEENILMEQALAKILAIIHNEEQDETTERKDGWTIPEFFEDEEV